MTRARVGSLVRQMEVLLEGGAAAALSDRQLLARFTGRDGPVQEAAFAALVARHGPMVLNVCRQIVGDGHLAEDAFQAVFLVLARKARSIRDPDLLGNWLHGVALRIARKARVRLASRQRIEEGDAISVLDAASAAGSADGPVLAREQAEALHDEIRRLSERFRTPVVLCYFEGLTLDEAARRLRWPTGTLRSRLARAREKLRRGLTRRGVVPSAALVMVLRPRSASARLSSSLCHKTTRAALQFAVQRTAGGVVSASAVVLAREVLRSMFINTVKLAAFTLAASVLVATGAGYLAHSYAASKEEPAALPATTRKEQRGPAPERMIVTGRVLDPQGKPVPGAAVDIIGRPNHPLVAPSPETPDQEMLGRGETDADGRFRFEAARSGSNRYFGVYALAAAPGFALGWAELNADAQQPAADIRLRIPQPIQGKLVGPDGKPAAGISIHVWSIGRPLPTGTIDGVNMGAAPRLQGLRNWPRGITTDDQGRFTITGVGRDFQVILGVNDPRFASHSFRVQTGGQSGPKEETLRLGPSVAVAGRVLGGDTGKSVPHALVGVRSAENELDLGVGTPRPADEEGRFSERVTPGKFYQIEALPPEGQPYLWTRLVFEQPRDAAVKPTDVKLVPGVVLRGKVTEKGTGRPIPGASVQYLAARRPNNVIDGWQAIVVSKGDGSFQITVVPGKGYLFVHGPTSDYVIGEIGGRMIDFGEPGGERYYAHAIVPYDVKEGAAPDEVNAELRPGKTVRGRLVGPEGQTVDNAQIIGLSHFHPFHLNWRGDLTRTARDGLFEIHGLDPEKPTRVSFLDADHQWGATVELSGKQADEAVEVRLQPCGQAKARFVGPDGKPVPNIFPYFEILGSQGPDRGDRRPESQAQLAADAVYLPNLDRKHYWQGSFTDAEGRITLPDLIPGAWYRIVEYPSNRAPEGTGPQVRRDFTVKPGETLDLGDILDERPSR